VVIDEAREGLDQSGLAGLAELLRASAADGVAVVVADQAAHAVPAGSTMVAINDGAVELAGAAWQEDDDIAVSFVGPSANAEDLIRHAAALGFRPTDAP
jgi:hypothetical protein